MVIIGCDLHSRYQVIAMLETETGEITTRRLEHEGGEAERFYRGLEKPALIGMEATGYTQWFERLVGELAGWRRPPPFGVCDVPKGHARTNPFHSGHRCAYTRIPHADLPSHLQPG
jgi:hypothetical protein